MLQAPDFTIVLPVYNGGLLLKDCVESILSQSYPHFILKVFNSFDNTDGSTEYLNSIADERVEIMQAETKLNIVENWARFPGGMDTEFGTIIGQDDLFHPDFLLEIKGLISAYPDASLWHSRYSIIDENGNVTGASSSLPSRELPGEYLRSILTVSAETVGTGYVFRCLDYKKMGGIPAFPDLLFADFALWFKLTSFGYKVNLQRELFSFRIHQSTTSRASPRKYFDGFKSFIDFLFKEAKINEEIRLEIAGDLNKFLIFYIEIISLRIIKYSGSKTTEDRLRVKEVLAYGRHVSMVAGETAPPKFTYKTILANMIDKNFLLMSGFRLFRKIYSKPILR